MYLASIMRELLLYYSLAGERTESWGKKPFYVQLISISVIGLSGFIERIYSMEFLIKLIYFFHLEFSYQELKIIMCLFTFEGIE